MSGFGGDILFALQSRGLQLFDAEATDDGDQESFWEADLVICGLKPPQVSWSMSSASAVVPTTSLRRPAPICTEAESEAEKHARDPAHLARNQLLRIHQNGGK